MFTYRLASSEDNQQLIALTAASGMTGEISLRIDRKPDFFKLLQRRGPTKVFVAEVEGVIVGCICVSLQQVYAGGKRVPLQYIGDFKVAAAYRKKGVGLQLCNEMASYIIDEGADLAFLNVAKGNTKPISFFKNRPQVPDFENIGLFNIHQFIGKKRKSVYPAFTIEAAAVTDELVAMLNRHFCQYQLGSVITSAQLEETSVFIIRSNHKIIAAICLADTMDFKQNVVTGLSWRLKYLLQALNALRGMAGISKMPVLNEPVRMQYIRYLAVDNQDKVMVQALINHARNLAYEKSYSFVAIGLHEKDPLNHCFAGMFKLSFYSVGMLVSIKGNKALVEKVKQGIPFEDYSLV